VECCSHPRAQGRRAGMLGKCREGNLQYVWGSLGLAGANPVPKHILHRILGPWHITDTFREHWDHRMLLQNAIHTVDLRNFLVFPREKSGHRGNFIPKMVQEIFLTSITFFFYWFPSWKKLSKDLAQKPGPGSTCEEVVTGTISLGKTRKSPISVVFVFLCIFFGDILTAPFINMQNREK
jgi:hypothetical protein